MNAIRTPDEAIVALPARAWIVPVASTVAGSAVTALLPYVALSPSLPPFGLLMLLGWRLLRPELWRVWVALPLGLADDLLTGRPPGSAMTLWTLLFLMLDMVDSRFLWRDHWQDWLLAAVSIAFAIAGGWAIAAFQGGGGTIWVVMPQIVMTIFCFPLAERLCAALDRWRLR
ncbi:rod shape-determining protein MreD [Flavisphingomonas formosensis]|uniref:rod shape-determining protein MreD n=1 Tax=Flavisphingomonas formosensis TaxID=861534 RepID=UPI0012F91486|nr:rod shape-determining protein MreD [Sphingomonas formosensis]